MTLNLQLLHPTRKPLALVSWFLLALLLSLSTAQANLLSPGALSRAHSKLEGTTNCASCHDVAGQKSIAVTNCLQCHKEIKASIDGKRGYHYKLDRKCETCHKEHIGVEAKITRWDPKKFNHAETGWKLDGAHAKRECKECHKQTNRYVGLKTECLACHKDQHTSDLKRACLECHSMEGWKQPAATFDHAKTKWALAGKHVEVKCIDCHKNNQWSSLKSECASCHNDPHKGKFNQACTECHTPGGWKKVVGFDHTKAGFQLVEKHATLKCDQCHNPRLKPVLNQKTCVSCHTDKHQGQITGQVSTECKSCHNETTWKPSLYKVEKHATTKYPLVGKHLEKKCEECHKENRFKFTAEQQTCGGCHQDYHKKQLDTKCEQCHTVTGWKPSNYTVQQHAKTDFALTGKHVTVKCGDCHKENRFAFAAKDQTCNACHQDKHRGQLSLNCNECHSTEKWTPSDFTVARHSSTEFPLTGKHTTTKCVDCHKEGKFKIAATDRNCISCHKDQHRGQFGTECKQCHNTSGWKGPNGITFDHSKTRFTLDGQHKTVNCTQCHQNGQFRGTPTECQRCHTQPHSGMLGSQCNDCHRETRWNDITFRHDRSNFVLQGKHNATNCNECHKTSRYKDTSSDCYSCHASQYLAAATPQHTSAAYPPTQCRNCHRNGGPSWRPAQFNHAAVFTLNRSHATANCTQCHQNGVYAGTPRNCYGCHQTQYAMAASPAHNPTNFPTDQCGSCHSDGGPSWRPATFTTHQQVFALNNTHSTTACAQCHQNNVYTGTPRECAGCHMSNYNNTGNPRHTATNFPTSECRDCHRDGGPGWGGATFPHQRVYSLVGEHRVPPAACTDCHRNNVYTNTPNTCWGCHQDDFNRAVQEKREHANYSHACLPCHEPSDRDWDAGGDRFNNHATFPLLNNHNSPSVARCDQCHQNNVYTGTSRECAVCHQSNYSATTNPRHVEQFFPSALCVTCHSSGGPGWTASFTHTASYPLQNRHATARCDACHQNAQYTGTTQDCYTCHQAQYTAAASPAHNASAFPPAQCVNCHANGGPSWRPATFNHAAVFPLQNDHATAQCTQCHINNVYAGTPRTCEGCHQPQYAGATNPPHNATSFPAAQCASCHSDGGPNWRPATFNHTAIFPLQNDHATALCASCHINNVYAGTPRTCNGCHQPQYTATTSPPHVEQFFPVNQCGTCHSDGGPAWQPAVFTHSATFALNGNHRSPSPTVCTACHTNTQYATTPTDCYACHQTQYTGATNPAHTATAQPTSICASCHTSGGPNWRPSTFNHATRFALQGRHATTTCTSCHLNNQYAGTPRDCYQCHVRTNPNIYPQDHQNSSQIMTTNCVTCHYATDNSWTLGRLASHPRFPIASGRHRLGCATCHTTSTTYLTFDCITCHQGCATITNMSEHRTRPNYSCTNAACYSCHPNGNGIVAPSPRIRPDRSEH